MDIFICLERNTVIQATTISDISLGINFALMILIEMAPPSLQRRQESSHYTDSSHLLLL